MVDWGEVGRNVAAFLIGAGIMLRPLLDQIGKKRIAQKQNEPWDGEERRANLPMTGRQIVRALEWDKSPIPKHWWERLKAKKNNNSKGITHDRA
jgi:hypothetical protein